MTIVVGVLLVLCSWSSSAWADEAQRPFWTEKSSFIEGDDLFVVGIASQARTLEDGRTAAFEHGKVELMNFAQLTSLEAKGLVIETQMTFEEAHPTGTFTVYRLLRVPVDRLVAIQEQVHEQTRIRETALEQARAALEATQSSLSQKQRYLEAQSRQVETTLESVSRLQETLGQKAATIERAQQVVEAMLRQLAAKVRPPGESSPTSTNTQAPSATTPATGSLVAQLKETEAKLDAQEAELKALAQRAKARLDKEEATARAYLKKCRYIQPGMTVKEVHQIMDDPTRSTRGIGGHSVRSFTYDYMDHQGATGMILIGFAFNELVESLSGCPDHHFSASFSLHK